MFEHKTDPVVSTFDGSVLKTFGKLTPDDIKSIDGQPSQLVNRLMEQYGWEQEVAEQKVKRFVECLAAEEG